MNELFIGLGKFLKARRRLIGFSQTVVAGELGTTLQFVSNFERGVAGPPMDLLKILIKLYKLSKSEVINVMLECQEQQWRKLL